MQEMADWLKALGLPEFARALADNGIDVSVLPHLTDQVAHQDPSLFLRLMEARDHHTTEPPQPAVVDAKNGVMCRAPHFPSALDGGSVW